MASVSGRLHSPSCLPTHKRRYKVKVFALYSAPFQEVFFLDSDSMPLLDPTPFFELESYKFNGSLFWPDHWCHHLGLFHLVGHDPWEGGRKHWWQTESGQFLFDRCF
jgi:alpha 1,2-mannosyltransferase